MYTCTFCSLLWSHQLQKSVFPIIKISVKFSPLLPKKWSLSQSERKASVPIQRGWFKTWSLLTWHLVGAFVWLESTGKDYNLQNLRPECSGDIWWTVPFIVKEYANCYVGLFLCQLFFLDPIRVHSSSNVPENHATKYNNTTDTIVTLMVAPFMI